jgi:hypothetical protein
VCVVLLAGLATPLGFRDGFTGDLITDVIAGATTFVRNLDLDAQRGGGGGNWIEGTEIDALSRRLNVLAVLRSYERAHREQVARTCAATARAATDRPTQPAPTAPTPRSYRVAYDARHPHAAQVLAREGYNVLRTYQLHDLTLDGARVTFTAAALPPDLRGSVDATGGVLHDLGPAKEGGAP